MREMKFGIRRPSLRKRIAARTSWKRYVRHSLGFKAPRGFGWVTNPKKALYNRVYNRTTVSSDKVAAAVGAAAAAGIGAMFAKKKSNVSSANSSTTCPRCHSPMVLRNGKLGKFYGCSRFPYCRGTRNYIPQTEQAQKATTQTTSATHASPANQNVGWVWLWAILAFISFVSDEAVLGLILLFIVFYVYKRGQVKPQAAHTSTQNSNASYTHTEQQSAIPKAVPANVVVDPDELKKIYHEAAHKFHPDTARTPEEQKMKEDIMKKINRAYQEKDLQTLKTFL